jgi:hypothetical protein
MSDCRPNALGVFWFRGKNEKLRSRVRRLSITPEEPEWPLVDEGQRIEGPSTEIGALAAAPVFVVAALTCSAHSLTIYEKLRNKI